MPSTTVVWTLEALPILFSVQITEGAFEEHPRPALTCTVISLCHVLFKIDSFLPHSKLIKFTCPDVLYTS